MHTTLRFEPTRDFADPRLDPGFQPEHWPQCNDHAAPVPDTIDLHERRCVEFLAAFYRLNVLNNQLITARKASAPDADIRSLLREVGVAAGTLEKLEDRYAPIGFFGEPVMDGVIYRSILFVRPELPKILSQIASLSSHIAIPGLEEIPESELRGEIIVRRWKHGKTDL